MNFPTNPTGGTMDRAELEKIAALARRRNLLVITDEIYSELTFEGEHVSIAALPGMKERDDFPARFFQGLRHDRLSHRLRLRAGRDY